MKTLQLSDETARRLYPVSPAEIKAVFEETWGKEFFSQKITDRIKTFEDTCTIIGIHPADAFHIAHSEYLKKDLAAVNAFMKLTIIARALNEGWEPDWKDENQYKYYPWFKANKSGSGFSYNDYDNWNTNVSSHLC